jgi:ribosomal protein S21
MVEVKRKPNESMGSLLRRFSRFVQQSRVLVRKKSLKTRPKKLTERQEKNRAIMGVHLRKLREQLQKQGKYTRTTTRPTGASNGQLICNQRIASGSSE